jgi:hypothetical protein
VAKLDWSKGSADPDPARVVDVGDYGVLSDTDLAALKSKLSLKKDAELARRKRIARTTFDRAIGKKDPSKLTIAQRIDVVQRSGGKDADVFIHETALMIIRHVMTCGDASGMNRLFLAMPNGTRRLRLAGWISRFSPIAVSNKKAHLRPKESKAYNEFDVLGASIHPFYS